MPTRNVDVIDKKKTAFHPTNMEILFLAMAIVHNQQIFNGHFRNLNWRYLPYLRPI